MSKRKRKLQAHSMSRIVLSRYEVARIIGLRALQIDDGATPMVAFDHGEDSMHIAARELAGRSLDVLVRRDQKYYNVKEADFPTDLMAMIDTHCGTSTESQLIQQTT